MTATAIALAAVLVGLFFLAQLLRDEPGRVAHSRPSSSPTASSPADGSQPDARTSSGGEPVP